MDSANECFSAPFYCPECSTDHPTLVPLKVLYIFVMLGGVYVWVLYCMDVWGLCNNVGVDMVGIVMVWVFW
jgi:hypothetical protein